MTLVRVHIQEATHLYNDTCAMCFRGHIIVTWITDLTLCDIRELARHPQSAEDPLGFPFLRRLTLKFQGITYPPLVAHYCRVGWICNLNNLEELVVIQRKHMPETETYCDIFDVLYGITFPRLATFEA